MKIAVAGATGRIGHHLVDVLNEAGHETVAISRSNGVDVITGQGLAESLSGVEAIIDAATGPSPEEQAATEFFTTAAGNLQEAGAKAGVRRLVVISIIGTDKFPGGYGAAKLAHERTAQAGPIPVHVVRASQFHEFVEQLMGWGRQGDVVYVPNMRTQVVAARSAAEVIADIATGPDSAFGAEQISEVAGPRPENLVELATLYAERKGDPAKIEAANDPNDPATAVYESGALLPGPQAKLVGPTFAEWLEAQS